MFNQRIRRLLKGIVVPLYRVFRPVIRLLGLETFFKNQYELFYWRMRKRNEGTLNNQGYFTLFNTLMELEPEFYRDKKILDLGCGPRGSLEWADMAAERVGLDPLVDSYRALGIDEHSMRYVNAPAEQIPYPDGYFDVVTSINSLDHVDDLDQTVSEIIRVTADGGHFLLAVEVNHEATIAEPHTLQWDIVDRFSPGMIVEYEKHYDQPPKTPGVGSALHGIPFDHSNPESRPGVLVARFRKD